MGQAREKIAVDFDDVLIDLADDYILHLNMNYGTKLTPEDYQKPGQYWTYYQHMGDVPAEEGNRRFDEYIASGALFRVGISEVAKRSLHRLKKERDLAIVTARWTEHYDETLKQVEREAPDLFEDVHFLRLWGDPANRDTYTKGMICQEIGAGYLIDDNGDHCDSAAELSVQGLLFGVYGWNVQHKAHPGVVRVPTWPSVEQYFKGRQTRAA
jgi:5'(3')-deoxyribonucleotidase